MSKKQVLSKNDVCVCVGGGGKDKGYRNSQEHADSPLLAATGAAIHPREHRRILDWAGSSHGPGSSGGGGGVMREDTGCC